MCAAVVLSTHTEMGLTLNVVSRALLQNVHLINGGKQIAQIHIAPLEGKFRIHTVVYML